MAITEVSLPPYVCCAGNEIEFIFETDKHAEDFIGIHCQLQLITTGLETVGNEKRLTLDANHQTTFDVSSLLAWEPEKEFSYPETIGTYLVKRNNLRKQFRVKRSEKYGNPLVEYNDSTTLHKYAIPGGLSKIQRGKMIEAGNDFWDKLQTEKFFFSNVPAVKTTDPFAFERLFFLVYKSGVSQDIYLKIKIEYTDGSSEEKVLDTVTCSQFDIFECILSPAAIGIDYFDTSKTVKQYTAFITESEEDDIYSAISETKTFKIDRIPRPNARYFLFNNSFKMSEGIRFAGNGIAESKYGSDITNRIGTSEDETDNPLIEKTHSNELQKWKINSGWISKDKLILYREFLLSKRVYWMINDMSLPVIVTSKKITTHKDDEHLYNVEVEYSLAHKDQFAGVDLIEEEKKYSELMTGDEQVSSFSNAGLNTLNSSGRLITSAVESDENSGYASALLSAAGSNLLLVVAANIAITEGEVWAYLYEEGAAEAITELQQLSNGQNYAIIRCPYDEKTNYNLRLGVPSGKVTNFSSLSEISVKLASPELLKKLYREANH